MRLTPRIGLAATAAALVIVCAGVGVVAAQLGLLGTLFEPEPGVPAAWIATAVVAGAIVAIAVLATNRSPGARTRGAMLALAAIGLGSSLWSAQLLAPFLALATWFAFRFWREGKGVR